ncbi:glutathione S-transferase [Crassisporium funariophilum]|nr:glutathione S-transferase [Crassisporium funariophilum]
MVLKLYGMASAGGTRAVAAVLIAKEVPFEFVEVDLKKKEHKTPEYLKMNPFGQIPLIDDDGFVLYEQRAIGRYIAEKYANQGVPLIPTELKAKALFEQAASVETANFHTHAMQAVMEKFYKPMMGKETDMNVYNAAIASLSQKLDVYDAILSKQKYLAGDEISLVDLWHLPVGSSLPSAGSDILETKPNVARWFKEVNEFPGWVAVKDGVKSTV